MIKTLLILLLTLFNLAGRREFGKAVTTDANGNVFLAADVVASGASAVLKK